MKNILVNVDDKFERYTVLEKGYQKRKSVLCKCECGNKQKVKIANLLSGRCTECKSCIAKRRVR